MNPFQTLTNNHYQQLKVCSSSDNVSMIFLEALWQYYSTIENDVKYYYNDVSNISQPTRLQSVIEKQLLRHIQALSSKQVNEIITTVNNAPWQFAQTTGIIESLLSVDCSNDSYFWNCHKKNEAEYQIKINESLQVMYNIYTLSLIFLDQHTDGSLEIEYTSPSMTRYEEWQGQEIYLIKQMITAHINELDDNNRYQPMNEHSNWYSALSRRLTSILPGNLASP